MIGRTLSHYEITAKLGEVAVKVLPEEMAADPERLERFKREAQAIAALNHPNIVTIHSVEEAEGLHLLTMELVDGQSLDQMLPPSGFDLDRLFALAIQIAEALASAHEKGIVHRDLKPANVMVTDDGRVKVLDFGLAKLAGQWEEAEETQLMTQAGMLLGTVPYMSPEQVQAKPVDHRSDIFSLGILLYEMATGERPFHGDNSASVISAVLKEQPPPVTELKRDLPNHLGRIVRRCLEKLPQRRFQSARDVQLELEGLAQEISTRGSSPERPGPQPPFQTGSRPATRSLRAALLLAAIPAALVVGLLIGWPATSPKQRAVRLSVRMSPETETMHSPALAESGDFLVFVGDSAQDRLYLRRLDEFTIHELPGTEGAARPFVSPDGRWIGFLADGKLKKIDTTGGDPIVLADDLGDSPGAGWGPGDSILFSRTWVGSGLYRVSAAGGTAERLTELDPEAGEIGHWWPTTLPGQNTILFTVWTAGTGLNDSQIAALDTDSGKKRILFPGAAAQYFSSGHLLYYLGGSYFVAPFDAQTLERKGPAVSVLPDAGRLNPRGTRQAFVSVSGDGTVAYRPAPPLGTLTWLDRDGREERWPIEPQPIDSIDLSPDGRRVAATVVKEGALQIWIYDAVLSTQDRLAYEGGSYFRPTWHPDGERVGFTGLRGGTFDVLWQRPGQEPEVLISSSRDETLQGFGDGGNILLYTLHEDSGDVNLWMMNLSEGRNELVASGTTSQGQATVSPDGRWVAFTSGESGQTEVYVQPFPGPPKRLRLSKAGGQEPRWAPEGGEIFYLRTGEIVSVSYDDKGGRFTPHGSRSLLRLPMGSSDYDIGPDGRFVVVHESEAAVPEIRVITNWTAGLEDGDPD
jgi:serine/threonine-protein kinase